MRDRGEPPTLNPNNPYAAAFAGDPANGAARIYYLFGDIPAGSDRTNEVYRVTAGLNGSFGDDWKWRVEGVYARDDLTITQHGLLNIAALLHRDQHGLVQFRQSAAQQRRRSARRSRPTRSTPSYSRLDLARRVDLQGAGRLCPAARCRSPSVARSAVRS